jgi:hypothetical protein
MTPPNLHDWSSAPSRSLPPNQGLATRQPHPRRITTTVPEKLHALLIERSDQEGRSVSNLVAFLLERALCSQDKQAPDRILSS